MPIVNSYKGSVLPSNSRAVDVAKQEIQRLIPAHVTKTDNTLKVNGYESIVYHRKTSGLLCACKRKSKDVQTRLDEDGNLHPGVIQTLVSGEFSGVVPYATTPKPVDSYFDINQALTDPFARVGTVNAPNLNSTSFGDNPNADQIIDDDGFEELVTGQVLDYGGTGITDYACPVCFGTGYVGGFDPINSLRIVCSYQDPTTNSDGYIDVHSYVPTLITSHVEFDVILPPARSIDSFSAWSGTNVLPTTITVDSNVLTNKAQLLRYCDGAQHKIGLTWEEEVPFTHLEIQLAQGDSFAIDFPKLTKQSIQSVLDSLTDVSLILSPRLPIVSPGDIIAESTFGKNFMVKNCNWHNDVRASILGWEVESRVIQPQELTYLLPRRNKTPQQELRSTVLSKPQPSSV